MTIPTNAAAASGGSRPARRIDIVGTLSVWVPQAAWRLLSDQTWPHPPELADLVHAHIDTVLVGEANQLMDAMCPGAGAAFLPDPFPQADRHGLTVHGVLTIRAPRAWGQLLVNSIDDPRTPSDAAIAADLDAFARETLVEVFDTLLATPCRGAQVWFRSETGDRPW